VCEGGVCVCVWEGGGHEREQAKREKERASKRGREIEIERERARESEIEREIARERETKRECTRARERAKEGVRAGGAERVSVCVSARKRKKEKKME